jgi:hypothetical protein
MGGKRSGAAAARYGLLLGRVPKLRVVRHNYRTNSQTAAAAAGIASLPYKT